MSVHQLRQIVDEKQIMDRYYLPVISNQFYAVVRLFDEFISWISFFSLYKYTRPHVHHTKAKKSTFPILELFYCKNVFAQRGVVHN